MKKALSIIVALSLVLGSSVSSYAATTATKVPTKPAVKAPVLVSKVGIIKSFTATSITLLEAGKTNTYVINKSTKVINLGTAADLMEVARKGLKATLKVNGKIATLVDIPSIGINTEGNVGIGVVESRTTVSDSPKLKNVAVTKNTASYDERTGFVNAGVIKVEDKANVQETSFTYVDATNIELGELQITTAASLKIKLNDKDLKVISDEKQAFDPANKADEVKLKYDAKTYVTSLEFESAITDNADFTQEDAEKIIALSFDKKEYIATVNDLSSFPINEDVYAELNGKEVTLAKALYRGNRFALTTNTTGEIIYVDAFYKDTVCKLGTVDKNNNLTISVMKFGNIAFSDVVKISTDTIVTDATGKTITIATALKAKKVIISTDPAANYTVVSIQVVE